MTDINDTPGWDDPDRAVQIEDDNPESLAGADTVFDPDADPDADPAPVKEAP